MLRVKKSPEEAIDEAWRRKAEMETKHKSIELVGFREESLPSGRKLLHCNFKDKFGTSRHVWTPPWKGESGVERLFFKALEIEEWNDYEGAWSKELKQASREIPSLEEIRLPVKIQLGEMEEQAKYGIHAEEAYRVAIEIVSDEKAVWKEGKGDALLICIGKVRIPWDSLQSFLLQRAETTKIRGVSKGIEDVTGCTQWYDNGQCAYWDNIGVSFYVGLQARLEKTEYRVIGKQIVSEIRSFIRKRLSDYEALKRGFEEL